MLAPCLHYTAYCFHVWVIPNAQHFRQHRKRDKPGFFHRSVTSMVHSSKAPVDWKEGLQLGASCGEWRWRSWWAMEKAMEEQGELPLFPSLGSRKRDWNNLPQCHCFSPLLSASDESQSLGRHPGVRLVYEDRRITKHLNNIKGSVGVCGAKSHFLSLKPSRVTYLTKTHSTSAKCKVQLLSSRHPSSTCPA